MRKKTKTKSKMRKKKDAVTRIKQTFDKNLLPVKPYHTSAQRRHLFELTLRFFCECVLSHGECIDLGILTYGIVEN